ncbi:MULTISPECIES: DUF445 domain-containing protein [unclassified Fusibacter]|uniref:DUF445 domain-containing protein n=1 Tax=unclassified Fusibacter TaxID=2624464 RepID=UPI001013627D|nr:MULTISPECIES: DUF445 family protein [unclassified Fusibacter]MCK8058697.1 DUF445 family protein [Fusibacter sp. A2]NPE21771.1 DUF445 family protein [Fusibacter sp. A1]RXV61345.1 DUF445 family protein [Fusibacter sp. A1]
MTILLMALIGGIIGWTTNIVAIKLLFRPIVAFKIPLIGFTIQGLIPKRHHEIAKSVADTIEEELLSLEQVLDQMIEHLDKKAVLALLEERIGKAIIEHLPPLARSFSGSILGYLHDMVVKQGDQLLNEITEALVHQAVEKISVSAIIEQKILEFDLEDLEKIIIDLARTELKQIERLGGVLGVLIGIIQGLLVVFIL